MKSKTGCITFGITLRASASRPWSQPAAELVARRFAPAFKECSRFYRYVNIANHDTLFQDILS